MIMHASVPTQDEICKQGHIAHLQSFHRVTVGLNSVTDANLMELFPTAEKVNPNYIPELQLILSVRENRELDKGEPLLTTMHLHVRRRNSSGSLRPALLCSMPGSVSSSPNNEPIAKHQLKQSSQTMSKKNAKFYHKITLMIGECVLQKALWN